MLSQVIETGISDSTFVIENELSESMSEIRPISLKSRFKVSGTVNAVRMARIIQKGSGKDVLESIKWKEFIMIYVQSVVFSFFIVCKNTLWSVKNYFDHRFGPTRRHIAHKFPALSLIRSGEAHIPKHQRSIACPHQLTDTQWGNHKYMKLKTTKFHYVESGAENDRLILLLHGFPDCFLGWRHQIPDLSRQHRVIALDLKGFSDSDKPAMRHKYRPYTICCELKDFLDALNIKTVIIIGHDLGGLIAWIFALIFPDYVRKLVVIAAPHPNQYWEPSTTSLTPRNWCKMVQMPFLPENELNKSVSFIKKFYRHLESERAMDDGSKCDGKELLETYKYIFNSSLDWTGPLNYVRNFMFYRVKPNLSIRCPSIIIAGNRDPNYKLEAVIKSAEYCENSLIRIIEGAGHFPHQSHWHEVNQILVKYLGGPKRRPEIKDEGLSVQRGLVGRMINKMYGVGQHYGGLSVNGGKIFSGLAT